MAKGEAHSVIASAAKQSSAASALRWIASSLRSSPRRLIRHCERQRSNPDLGDEAARRLPHGQQAQRHALCRCHVGSHPAGLQHKAGTIGFTARYGCKMLVWYEIHEEMLPAIAREKQIKAGSRRTKLVLI